MRKLLFLAILICSTSAVLAQNETVGCENKIVDDAEKRDYMDDSISVDIDGDDKADSITARTYKSKVVAKANSKIKETH